eukprot:NODE_174_length_14184_cov_0.583671.p1 type:complete len:1261 gc:universal NODE_174_length_14184_cov_0.583671:9144-5362(-)
MVNYNMKALFHVKNDIMDQIISLKGSYKDRIESQSAGNLQDKTADSLFKPVEYMIKWVLVNKETGDVDQECSNVLVKSDMATLCDELENLLPVSLDNVDIDCLKKVTRENERLDISLDTKLASCRDSQIIEVVILCDDSDKKKYLLNHLGALKRWTKATKDIKINVSVDSALAPKAGLAVIQSINNQLIPNPIYKSITNPPKENLIWIHKLDGRTTPIYIKTPCSFQDIISHLCSKNIQFNPKEHKLFSNLHNISSDTPIDSDFKNIHIQPRQLGGSFEDLVTTDCPIADRLSSLDIVSYNCRGQRNGCLDSELKRLIETYHPSIMHLTEYRVKKDPFIKGYKIYKFKHQLECDRQCIMILNEIEDISLVSQDSLFSHTIRINSDFYSFNYLPPRYRGNLESIKTEMEIGFNKKALFVGDFNQKCPSAQVEFDRHGRNFESYMSDKCYLLKNTPCDSTMVSSLNCFDQVWIHNSLAYKIDSIHVLRNNQTNSDHYPILFKFHLDNPLLVLRNINYSLIKTDLNYREQFVRKLNQNFESFLPNISDLDCNSLWNKFKLSVVDAARKVLPITSFRDRLLTTEYDDRILNLSTKIKRFKRHMKGRRCSGERRTNLKRKIKMAQKNLKVARKTQKNFEFNKYLDKVNIDQSSAYIELCKLRQQRKHQFLKSNIHDAIHYHTNHFSSSDALIWPYRPTAMTQNMLEETNNLFTLERITHMFKTVNSKKASGDSIPVLVYKYLPKSGYEILHSLLLQCYLNQIVPYEWSISQVIEVFKSGDDLNSSRYRPISLISIAFKVYQQVIYYHHYRLKLQPSLRQHGFCQKRSCSTQIHAVLDEIKRCHRVYGQAHCLALDLSTAFDTIKHTDVFNQLQSILPDHDLNVLRNIICDQRFTLKRDSNNNEILMCRGTPQGGTLSPLIFSFVIDRILAEIPNSENRKIFAYADDIFVVSWSLNTLISTTNRVTDQLQSHGFLVNQSKFQFVSSDPLLEEITLNNGISISKQSNLKYLGLFINSEGIDYRSDIAYKVAKANFATSTIQWTNRFLQFRNSYSRFYNGVLMPILCYGIENYTAEGLDELEKHRTKIIKNLHSQKYRYFQMIYNYLSIHNQYRIKLLTFNDQLSNLGYTQINNGNDQDRKAILEANQILMDNYWNSQPQSNRVSVFKTDDKIIKLAKRKNPNHLQKIFDSFLTGRLPPKSLENIQIKCNFCNRNFKNLDHFTDICNGNLPEYISRSTIYRELKSSSEILIISQLKFIRNSTRKVYGN